MTDTAEKLDYSKTLYLPETDFPMRAGLPQKEPELVARWQQMDLYRKLRASAAPASLSADVTARLEALEQRVDGLQQELSETHERLDFAERLLSQARDDRRIGG